jgi:signal transduction histidine kinase
MTPGTLRTRLALLYLGVFGLIQVGLGAAILLSREITVRREFDEYLAERAGLLAELVEIGVDNGSQTPLRLPRVVSNRPRAGHWELRLPNGAILQRSESLGDAPLPWPPLGQAPVNQRQYWTVEGQGAAAYLGTLRVLRVHEAPPGIAPYYIQLARETAPIEENIRQLRRLFMIAVPIGLAVSALAAGFVARRSLEPISRIARTARAITAASLAQRIPRPFASDEVAELVDVINGMLERLDAAFQAEQRFVADVSHELKTPLIALAAEAETVARADVPEAQRQAFLADVHDRAVELARTVDSFLVLARAEAGFPLARPQLVPLPEVVTEAVRACASAATVRQTRLRTTLSAPDGTAGEGVVLGEEELLRSLLENLIRNAVRFSPPGSVVDISLSTSSTSARIEVSDRGPGVPEEHLDRIFQRFFRLESPDSGKADGSGLGLAIARAIARLHGGDVVAAPREGGGLRLIVTLPLNEDLPQNQAGF